ncbi:MAG: autotransporter domain-containing protein, partial [Pseudomonadota bacterium]
ASESITASGAGSHAIHAREAGAGRLTLTSSGALVANGADAHGILVETNADSVATVHLVDDEVAGGSGTGAGVVFETPSGAANTLNVGASARVSALSTVAVRGGAGNETINNHGALIGSVDLGDGADLFNLSTEADFSGTTRVDGGDGNEDTFVLSGPDVGVFGDPGKHTGFEKLHKTGDGTWTLAGAHSFRREIVITRGTLDLADDAILDSQIISNENGGTLSIGGQGKIGTATIFGSYRQQGSAYAVDVDPQTGRADLLVVTATADVKGVVNVNILTSVDAGTHKYEIVRATGNTRIDDSPGAGTLAVVATSATIDTSQLDVTLELGPDDKTIYLVLTASAPVPTSPILHISGMLNLNQQALVNALNSNNALGAGSSLQSVMTALIDSSANIGQYRAALNVLLPEVHLNTETAMLFSAHDFMGDLFSCPTADAGAAIVHEGQCLWVRPKGRKFDRDATFENIGYEETVGGVSAGAQFSLAPGWFANVGGSYEHGSLSTDTGAESDSDRFQVGGAVKYEMGPWLFAGAISGGIGTFDTSRPISFSGFNGGTATSEHDVRYIAGQLRAAYQFAMPGWYVRPLVDLNVTYLDRDGVTENGAGAANLRIDSGEETVFSATPGIEIGGTYEIIPGATLKPFLMAGVTVFGDDDHSLTSAFALAPDVTFETTTEHGDVFGNVHAGLTLVGHDSGFDLTLGYKGVYSDDVTQHGVYAKGALKF